MATEWQNKFSCVTITKVAELPIKKKKIVCTQRRYRILFRGFTVKKKSCIFLTDFDEHCELHHCYVTHGNCHSGFAQKVVDYIISETISINSHQELKNPVKLN